MQDNKIEMHACLNTS